MATSLTPGATLARPPSGVPGRSRTPSPHSPARRPERAGGLRGSQPPRPPATGPGEPGARRRSASLWRAAGGDESGRPLLPGGARGPGDAPAPVDWAATGRCFLFPALAGALFGYDIGASGGALQSLTSPELSGTDWYALSSSARGLVVSLSLLGALAGSGAALAWGDRLGRRGELMLAAALYAAGAAGAALAPGATALMAARGLYGLGIGLAMHAAPAYIAETAPAAARGRLISTKEGFIVGGILLGYVGGLANEAAVGGWRLSLGAAAPLALAVLAGVASLPESPRWLALAGRPRGETALALRRARGSALDAAAEEREVAEIEAAARGAARAAAGGAAGDAPPGPLGLLAQPRFRRPLAVGLGLMLFQQVTGQPSVLYYANQVLADAGVEGAAGAAVLVGAFKLLATGAAVGLVEGAGRRPLLLAGVSAMAASLAVLSGAQSGTLPGLGPPAAVGALLVYVGAYQVSFGPISWLMCGEVFPLAVRSQAIALATMVNFGANFLVSLALPAVQEELGLGGTFALFAGLSVAALAFVAAAVPETKGRTLEEIERMWG